MTVCLDVEGPAGAAPDLGAIDDITHIAVVDRAHEVDRAFGIVNVPMAVWVDEDLQVVRPAEYAWPGEVEGAGMAQLPPELPDRMMEMGAMAAQIQVDRTFWLDAVRDWAANGSASSFVLDADTVMGGSVPRGAEQSAAAAHFELAQHLHLAGQGDAAVEHFRSAHRLDPGNWTYKRQAWELASRVEGPLARFWQGPVPGTEDDWPYDGDWLTDVAATGPENYYPPHVT